MLFVPTRRRLRVSAKKRSDSTRVCDLIPPLLRRCDTGRDNPLPARASLHRRGRLCAWVTPAARSRMNGKLIAVGALMLGALPGIAAAQSTPQVKVGGVVYAHYLYQLTDEADGANNFDIA